MVAWRRGSSKEGSVLAAQETSLPPMGASLHRERAGSGSAGRGVCRRAGGAAPKGRQELGAARAGRLPACRGGQA